MTLKYVSPKFDTSRFNCPHCGAFSHHKWKTYQVIDNNVLRGNIYACLCISCCEFTIWYKEKMIYPFLSVAPFPHEDMPEDVKSDFNEARKVVNISPRSAVALLRLALEKLANNLGAKGGTLDKKIAWLVKKGLPEEIQRALDSVRVIGNEAVHPGQIDLKDDVETAASLFELMNFIVQDRITKEKKINKIYEILPESKKEHIEERDKKK